MLNHWHIIQFSSECLKSYDKSSLYTIDWKSFFDPAIRMPIFFFLEIINYKIFIGDFSYNWHEKVLHIEYLTKPDHCRMHYLDDIAFPFISGHWTFPHSSQKFHMQINQKGRYCKTIKCKITTSLTELSVWTEINIKRNQEAKNRLLFVLHYFVRMQEVHNI